MPTIRVAHGPDADDAFMFHALAAGGVYPGDHAYVHDPAGIDTLDRRAAPLDIVVATPGTRATTHLALLLYQPAAISDSFFGISSSDFTAVRGAAPQYGACSAKDTKPASCQRRARPGHFHGGLRGERDTVR